MKLRKTCSDMRTVTKSGSVATLAIMVLLLPAMSAAAQDEPKPQERVSQPGEMQTGQKKAKAVRGAAMKPEQRPAATLVNGKILEMEAALKMPQRIAGGKRQASVDLAQAENPKAGTGEQKPRTGAEAKLHGSHLELVLKISSTGAAEVTSAKESPGPAATSETAPGQWLYAVFSGNRTIAVQGIPDPFEMRSFAPPPGSPLEGQGHHIERAKTALISVAVPNLTLKSPEVSRLSIQLYQVKEGAPLLHVDPSVFQKLQQEKRLEMKIRVPAATLSRQIRLRAPGTTTSPQ
jgi:hypothetical protein